MMVRCEACNTSHYMTPTSMRYALLAFQKGDAQIVGVDGVRPMCLGTARQAGELGEEVRINAVQ